MTDSRVWYYAKGNQKVGPLQRVDLEKLVSDRTIGTETLVWAEGMSTWEFAKKHFYFLPSSPPNLPAESDISSHVPGVGSAAVNPSGEVSHLFTSEQLGNDDLYVHAPRRSFGEAISVCFRKYATFMGRASRSEFWFFFLFAILVSVAAMVVDTTMLRYDFEEYGQTQALTDLTLLLPGQAVAWRRLHDTNRSGWWVGGFWLGILVLAVIFTGTFSAYDTTVGLLLPIAGFALTAYVLLLFVFMCQKGNTKQNRYG